jgi:hypothetical protein
MLESLQWKAATPDENLPGLYALAFFCVKCVQHFAHSHRFGLV